MRPDQIGGKQVIDAAAQVMGEVCDIEFDVATWLVTDICVILTKTAIELLGYKQPGFRGKVLVDLPTKLVKVIKDVVVLDKSIEEIKHIVELH
jgi:sporulation protein YlmC with PRC-barrel domain